jgi:Animal haem peroxidase
MAKADEKNSRPMSRRHFLGAVGAGVMAASASSSLLAPVAQAQRQRFVRIREDRFGRMFHNLDPFYRENTPALQAALRDIGKPGGILDARDELGDGDEAAAMALIVDPALSANNPNNLAQTAGTTFIGQFIDHDLTFDQTSALGRETEPADSLNTRNPRFDLDSVYGDGPLANPELYEPVSRRSRERPTKLRIESGGLFEDVPRNQDGSAIIADPRNDENMVISGLQAAFILFHNNAVDLVKHKDRGASSEEVYEKANQLTRWHYQWIVLHEILPLFIGQAAVDHILNNGRKFYRPEKPQIPVEFQGAAYRMGHTLVRPSYRANLAGDNDGTAFFGMVFDPSGELPQNQADPPDLRGGARARRRFIGWQTFFDFGPAFTDAPGNPNPAIRPNKRVDATISTPLFHLPIGAIAGGVPGDIISLPQRNLLRGVTWSLPSGQSIARTIGAPVLDGNNDPVLRLLRDYDTHREKLNLDDSTPLWFYVLNEGLRLGNEGRHLGPVGGRIVGEVFIGLLQLDRDSYLNAETRWKPTIPQRNGRTEGFRMIDFLAFAGVAPDQRGAAGGGGLPTP